MTDDTPRPLPVPTGAHPGDPVAAVERALDTASTAVDHAQPKPSRAGRNLPAAIGVGVGLGALTVLSLFWRPELFVILLVATVAQASRELVDALAVRGIRVPMVPLLLGVAAMAASAWFGGAQHLVVAFVGTVLLLLVAVLLTPGEGKVRDASASVFAAGYVPYLAGFAILMLAQPDGPWRLVTMIAVPVFGDIGGYVFGVLWGRHPMAPSVSPKKSWEGMAGSVVFGTAAALVGVSYGLGGAWWGALLVGLVAVVMGVLGDLSESLLKRDLGIKDMGTLLPGHGGVLDRIDSLLPTAPVMYLLLSLVAPA